jgi:hypothetical protein
MESASSSTQSPRPIISKAKIKHSSSYTVTGSVGSIGKPKRKRVRFIDKANNEPISTTFNYEQVDMVIEVVSPKSVSCTCAII